MTVSPNVTSSELNGLTLNLANTHCIATPATKKHGAIRASVASGSMPVEVES